MTDLLSIEELTCGYAGEPVCGPVSLTVAAGDSVVILGENGTGKSTLLKTVAGRLPEITGAVSFRGEPRDEASLPWRTAVSSVFDDAFSLPHLSVREHLMVVALGNGMHPPDAAVDEALEAWGIAGRADADPFALSSGQRRRFHLAAVFLRPAELLLLDEPEQRLDTGTRQKLITRLEARREQGTALMIATHDFSVARALGQHRLWVEQDGEVSTLSQDEVQRRLS